MADNGTDVLTHDRGRSSTIDDTNSSISGAPYLLKAVELGIQIDVSTCFVGQLELIVSVRQGGPCL